MTLTHPKLPGREIDVQEVRVRHLERAGWRRKQRRQERPVEKPAESASKNPEGEA